MNYICLGSCENPETDFSNQR